MPRPPIFLLGALLVSATSCDRTPPPLPTEAGVSRELADLRRATLSDVAYDVALEIPAARTESVRGRTVVSFVWNDPEGRAVVLDFLEPAARVGSVEVNGRPAEWRAENDHVVVDAGALRRRARNELVVTFQAGDGALNRSDDFLYTLFVPDRARYSLPVFDQPSLRARFTLSLTVPDGWTAVANGRTVVEPPRVSLPGRDGAATAADAGTFRFSETPPIPTYLFAFAAGRFQVEEAERGGRRLRMFHRETDSARVARNREAVFDLHQRALDWLEAYTEIRYPFEKFDFVLIPAFQYGGMEHPGAVFYRQEGILLEASATEAEQLGRASLIAHETAHMWFGDLVTLDWFDDVWTKEVFANFMAAKIVHPSFPQVDHQLRFLLAHHPAAYRVDRTAGANPIRQPLANLREAGALYGPIIYQKAPVVMQHLERRVGEEALRDGLREYLRAFSFGNATWPDLIGILDARTSEDLAAWSRVWVEEPGRPTVSVVLETEGDRVRVFGLQPEDPEGKGRGWPQRVRLALVYGDSVVPHDVDLDLTGEAALEAGAGRPAPDLVIPNGSGIEYGRFVLDERSLAALLSPGRLAALPTALLRGAAWVTLWDAVLDGAVSPERFVALSLEALRTETVEQNLQRILDSLGEAWWRLLSAEARDAHAAAVEGALWQGATASGPATVRAAFLGAYRRVAVTPAATARLARLWSGEERPPVPLAESDQTALAWGLALREAPGWERVLDGQAERITNPDRRARFDFVRPALSADPAAREALFRSLLDPANRRREPWVLDALSLLAHPLRQEHALRFLTPALEELEEIQRTGDIFFPDRWLDAALAGHNSTAAAREVRAFLDARPDYPPRLRAKVLQAADGLFRAARIVEGDAGAAG
jgi:aminopeptidase N